MRNISLTLDYLSLSELLECIDEPNRSICKHIYEDNQVRFEMARGSTHNHQAWEGGYIDHITDGMNFGRHLYEFVKAFGRPMPFTLPDVMLVFFLHDLEKPWRIMVDAQGNATNKTGLTTKEQFKFFREQKLREYGISLTPYQMNGLTYVEGEYKDYSSKRRVMNELAAFVHMVDNWCARGWYDYPKKDGEDGWTGAGRYRKNLPF
jgi:hypothetical protein